MNIDLKSQFFFQSKFKAATNSMSKNVVAGFDQKKSNFNLESDEKCQRESDNKKNQKKEDKNFKKDNSEKEKQLTNSNSSSAIKKLMNII